MIRLLRTVSWSDYRAAPGRLLLMLSGIAVGMALIAGIDIINKSVLVNFRTMLERAAGRAELQIELGTGEIGFDESVVGQVETEPGVQHAFAMIRGTLHADDDSGEVLQLFGVDLLSSAVDSYDVRLVGEEKDKFPLIDDPSSILLTEDYAARRGLHVGSRVQFATPTGVHELTVRGLLKATGIALIFGGNLAVMDLPAAQGLLGKEGRIDQIDVLLQEGSNVDTIRDRLRARLPPSLSVTRPALRGERFERVVGAFQAMLDGLSLLSLLAGIFIVYNTSATAITQRARDLAILVALGAERRTIFGLVVAEAVGIGLVASAIGIGFGIVLARLLSELVAQSMGVVYQMRVPVESVGLQLGQVWRYLAIGTLSAAAAAAVPARKASLVDPLDMMRPDFRERLTISSPNGLLVGVWAAVFVAAGLAVYVERVTRSIRWGNVAATLFYISAVIISIPVMNWVSRGLARVLPRVLGLEGRIAAEGLTRVPARTGVAAAVVAVSLAVAVTLASVALSFRESERNWFILTGDLVVSAVGTEGGWLESPISAEVGTLLGTLPGVARVETYRALQGQEFRDGRIAIVSVSPGFVDGAAFRSQVVAGDAGDAVRALGGESEVVISDNLADRFHLGIGDDVVVPAPSGLATFRVAAIVSADYSGDQGSILIGRERFEALWGDNRVSHFNLFLAPGASLERVREEVFRTLRGRYVVKVLTVPQTLAYHQGMVDRAFAFTYAIQLLVVAVTLAGIVDVLTTQIIERRHEIGILQALGAEERTITRSISLEALVIGLVGSLLGVAISVGTSRLWVYINFRILIGYILEHHFAVLTALWCVVLASAVSMLAGHLAARRALRLSTLEALRFE